MSDLKPVYLIGGSDHPKVVRAVRRLRERVGSEGTETLSAAETTVEDAIAACNALGLLTGEARLVLVEDAERWKAPDAKAIAAYLERPAPDTVLALVAGEIKRDSALAKACAKAGDLLLFDAPKKRDLPGWVADQFARLGATAEPDACRALVELCGDDLQALTTEIEKLATWAGEETIGARDVERLGAPFGDLPPWALTDRWGDRNVAGVIAAMEETIASSDRPRSDSVARLAAQMGGHVRLVAAAQRAKARGVRPEALAKELKRPLFPVQKAFRECDNFSVEELRDAVVRLAQLDHAIKGGSRLSGELEVARALIDITRRAESPAA